MKSTVYWNEMSYSPVEVHQYFGGLYSLHLQSPILSETINWQELDGMPA
jgi:hypothetical protein